MEKLPFLAFLVSSQEDFWLTHMLVRTPAWWEPHRAVCPSISLPSVEPLHDSWYSPPLMWSGHLHVIPPFPTETFALLLSPWRKGRTAEEECEFGERRTEKYLFWNTNIAFPVAEAKGILPDAASFAQRPPRWHFPAILSSDWDQPSVQFSANGVWKERTTLSGLPCKPPAMYSTHSLLWWMLVLPNWKKPDPLN